MFDYKLLEALGAAVDEGGFEKASRKLHITQSAVSQRIKLLEESEGQVLITRTSPPCPTNRGLELLAHYRRVKLLEDGLHQKREEEHRSPTTFSIGINADSLATWFLPCVAQFLREHSIILDIHVEDQEQTLNLLKKGRVWGCVSTREVSAHGCAITTLGTMRYSLCCTPDYMAKWFPGGISIDSVRQAPIMRFNRNDHLNDSFFIAPSEISHLQDVNIMFLLPSLFSVCSFRHRLRYHSRTAIKNSSGIRRPCRLHAGNIHRRPPVLAQLES